jgi:hypothetical protein
MTTTRTELIQAAKLSNWRGPPQTAAELHARGVEVSYYGVWHFLDHTGLSFNKSLRASEQDRADVARRRRQWRERQSKVGAARLIFIEETWAKTNGAVGLYTRAASAGSEVGNRQAHV